MQVTGAATISVVVIASQITADMTAQKVLQTLRVIFAVEPCMVRAVKASATCSGTAVGTEGALKTDCANASPDMLGTTARFRYGSMHVYVCVFRVDCSYISRH